MSARADGPDISGAAPFYNTAFAALEEMERWASSFCDDLGPSDADAEQRFIETARQKFDERPARRIETADF